jgi:IS5 family transposase
MKLEKAPTLADRFYDLRTRKMQPTFFTLIHTLLDWKKISLLIDTHYQKEKSTAGKPSYDGLLLFKMGLHQTWYGLVTMK